MKRSISFIKKKLGLKTKKGGYDAENFKNKETKKAEKALRNAKALSLSVSNLEENQIFEDRSLKDYYLYPDDAGIRPSTSLRVADSTNQDNAQIVKPSNSKVQITKPKFKVILNEEIDSDLDNVSVDSFKSCLSDPEYIEMDEISKDNLFIKPSTGVYNDNLRNLIKDLKKNDQFQKQAASIDVDKDETSESISSLTNSSAASTLIKKSTIPPNKPAQEYELPSTNEVSLKNEDATLKNENFSRNNIDDGYEDHYAYVDYQLEKRDIEKDMLNPASNSMNENPNNKTIKSIYDDLEDDLNDYAEDLDEGGELSNTLSTEDLNEVNRFESYLNTYDTQPIPTDLSSLYSNVDYISKREKESREALLEQEEWPSSSTNSESEMELKGLPEERINSNWVKEDEPKYELESENPIEEELISLQSNDQINRWNINEIIHEETAEEIKEELQDTYEPINDPSSKELQDTYEPINDPSSKETIYETVDFKRQPDYVNINNNPIIVIINETGKDLNSSSSTSSAINTDTEEIKETDFDKNKRNTILGNEDKDDLFQKLVSAGQRVTKIENVIKSNNYDKQKLLLVLFKELHKLSVALNSADEELLDIHEIILTRIQKCIDTLKE